MKVVTTREAQHHFSKILEHLESGEDVIVTRRGKRVAKISSITTEGDGRSHVDWKKSFQAAKQITEAIPPLTHPACDILRDGERY